MKELSKEFEKSEDDLKSLQSGVGQIVGEVLRQLTEEKCMHDYVQIMVCIIVHTVIVKASNGPRYVVGCRRQVY